MIQSTRKPFLTAILLVAVSLANLSCTIQAGNKSFKQFGVPFIAALVVESLWCCYDKHNNHEGKDTILKALGWQWVKNGTTILGAYCAYKCLVAKTKSRHKDEYEVEN